MNQPAETAAPVNPVRALPRPTRNRDPYLHIDPCYLNVPTCTKTFGYYFTEFYLSHTVKENNDYARIFNDHLLVTFTMDACRDREMPPLGVVLADPTPGEMFFSTEALQGTDAVFGKARARNRVLLPYDCGRDVFVEFDPHHFLSDAERVAHAHNARATVLCHVDIVKDDLVSATALIMGTPSFTHFRNENEVLDFDDHAADWFETWPEDIDELAACADIPLPPEAEWRAALGSVTGEDVCDALAGILGGTRLQGEAAAHSSMIAAGIHRGGEEEPAAIAVITDADARGRALEPAALRARPDAMVAMNATPAELWIVQHCHTIGPAVRDMVRACAVRPHAPRRFCLIDGADTYRILKAYGRL